MRFAVIWIPQSNLTDTIHKVKTHDDCRAACRLGLHPCAGSQGKAWLDGTEVEPPAQFEIQNGWISVSKARDQAAVLPTSLPQPRPSNISRASPRDLRRPMRTHGNRAQAHVQDIMAAHQLWHHPCRARRNMCSISLMKLSRNYKIMLLPLWHPI